MRAVEAHGAEKAAVGLDGSKGTWFHKYGAAGWSTWQVNRLECKASIRNSGCY